ncbi:DUF4198 domain-containing protein [Campylobacter sp. 19-13652]|uniref:DUF4198 domain-containing protein n=1 Tax=Campylobacter sp. 19-13652 TaxID=2840180 RepID=UPI001C7400C8|nr:DUF4198 domain-containing protein [Campylobacter sp. 19-13652]BCX78768.1 hypothetical protein LBC_02300 [Campylobacter sp. 19-13652]
MKLSKIALAALLLVTASSAHDLWVVAKQDKNLSVDLIYGHDFANPEPIAKKRLSLFDTPYALGKNGKTKLSQVGENYHYEATKVGDDTHIIVASYKPTDWTQKSDGKWEMNKNRADFPDAKQCLRSSFKAKFILAGNDDGSFATKALGEGLEITPVSALGEIRAGEISRFRLTRDGEPVANAEITGGFAGYVSDHGADKGDGHGGDNDEMRAFFNKTDKNGEFSFKPLVGGLWFVSTEVERSLDDSKCEKEWSQASLTFWVK